MRRGLADFHLCVGMCVYVCICVCIYVSVYASVMYVCICVCIYIPLHVSVCAYLCVCVYVCVYKYVCVGVQHQENLNERHVPTHRGCRNERSILFLPHSPMPRL